MTNKFTPIQYLERNDRALLEETKYHIKAAKTENELRYYEIVLDNLMKKAVKSYNKQTKRPQEA